MAAAQNCPGLTGGYPCVQGVEYEDALDKAQPVKVEVSVQHTLVSEH